MGTFRGVDFPEEMTSDLVEWTQRYLAHVAWRAGATHELDDLFEEALICWIRCRARKVPPEEFAGYYKRSVKNRVVDLGRRLANERRSRTFSSLASSEVRFLRGREDPRLRSRQVEAEFRILVSQLPGWLRRLVLPNMEKSKQNRIGILARQVKGRVTQEDLECLLKASLAGGEKQLEAGLAGGG